MIEVRNSDVQKFIECKRKFYLEYVLGLNQQQGVEAAPSLSPDEEQVDTYPSPTNAHNGTMVHAGLDAYYHGKSPDNAVVAAASDIAEEGVASPEWVDAIDVANKMVRGYIEWVELESLDQGLSIFDTELALKWEMPGVTLTGRPDLLVRDEVTGLITIFDFKTVANLNMMPRPGNWQLLTYAVLVNKALGLEVDTGAHRMIKRDKRTARSKGPWHQQVILPYSPEMLEMHERRLETVTKQIARFVKANDPAAPANHLRILPNFTGECSWKCDVLQVCDLMDDGSDWEYIASTYRRTTRSYLDE